jgi:hypothetical protein
MSETVLSHVRKDTMLHSATADSSRAAAVVVGGRLLEGSGQAIINRRRIPLKARMMILIEAGETHEIRNTGRNLLKTVSIYVPPAYHDDGDERPAGRSSI